MIIMIHGTYQTLTNILEVWEYFSRKSYTKVKILNSLSPPTKEVRESNGV